MKAWLLKTRFGFSGPIEDSNTYAVKYHLNVNRDFNGVKNGQFNGELSIAKGNSLSFTEQNLRIKQYDTLYYWVEIQGQNSARTWFKEYKGFYQLPCENFNIMLTALKRSLCQTVVECHLGAKSFVFLFIPREV